MTSESAATLNHGTLLLADISGYTAFLQAVGGAHGQEMAEGGAIPAAYPMMTTLLDGIVERLVPPFTLSKTEGDAVFAFAPDVDLQLRGQDVLGCIDVCYRAFRDRLEAMDAALSCRCSACETGIELDLKFVLHSGDYVEQPIAGRRELLGPDVNTVHRLLKNEARKLIGGGAYALLTEAATTHLEIPVAAAAALTERYDHFPPIDAFVFAVPGRPPC
jgi:hypothetical protein